MLDYANVGDIAGLFFRTKDGHDLTNTQIPQAFTDFDSGRQSRVRYDTPKWQGLTLVRVLRRGPEGRSGGPLECR